MQRNFEPMRRQVEAWQRSELTDVTAKVVIYEVFVEGKLGLRNISPARSSAGRILTVLQTLLVETAGVGKLRALSRHLLSGAALFYCVGTNRAAY
jgi:hypothetical protein